MMISISDLDGKGSLKCLTLLHPVLNLNISTTAYQQVLAIVYHSTEGKMKIHTRMLIACQWRIPESKRTIADFNLTSGDLLLKHQTPSLVTQKKPSSSCLKQDQGWRLYLVKRFNMILNSMWGFLILREVAVIVAYMIWRMGIPIYYDT